MKQRTARSFSLRGILWLAGMLAIATGTGRPAQAGAIRYNIFSNGGMVAPFGNTPVSIAGHFNYDPATNGIDHFDVTFTTTLGFGGTSTDGSSPVLLFSLGQPRITFEGPNGYAIDLFLNDFGGLNTYDIRFIDARDTPDTGYTLLPADAQNRPIVTILTGSEAPVPEPATFGLASAFFLLLVCSRRILSEISY